VLNAKNHMQEAEIVQKAGQPGAITIATNMAGRGTDIKLGAGVRDPRKDPEGNDWPGGLQIIGTERHESRRIDRQLRGRAGRQGDPGTSRFFVSLEDDLMQWFGSERISTWLSRLGLQEGEPIVHPWVTKAIGNAQKKVEGINQERRKRTLEYDDVMNKQRETIYKLRREILVEDELRDIMLDIFADALEGVFTAEYGEPRNTETWNLDGYFDWLTRTLVTADLAELRNENIADFEDLLDKTMAFIVDAYEEKAASLPGDMINRLARYIALSRIDAEWQDHLLAIDSLREGIHMRSYGQRDPLVEFTKDATDMFSQFLLTIHREILEGFFRMQLMAKAPERPRVTRAMEIKPDASSPAPAPQAAPADGGDEDDGGPRGGVRTFKREMPKVGRNEACPCGSGKKFKDCHGSAAYREPGEAVVPSSAPQD
jgi:preprotein translocase subunit SecA